MRSSDCHSSVPQSASTGEVGQSLELLAIDFIDVNRSLTLATQLANLTRLWTHQAHLLHQAHPAGLGGLGTLAGEIDRLLLDCQFLLPRLAEVVDRFETDPSTGAKTSFAAAVPGPAITIDGAAASLRSRAEREYGGDISVAAADFAARAVLAAETRRLQLWQEFGRIAQGNMPAALLQDSDLSVTISFGTTMSLREWLADSAQATVAWLSGQLGIR